ncbi:MAG TPA: hypothetical protein VF950_07730 [Planctomycetota bacterium]
MAASDGYLRTVGALAAALDARGFEPVLVGGMALVLLGSQRVTRDFDLLVSTQGPSTEDLVRLMYRHRLELVTKFSPEGEVKRTVDNVRIAVAKLKAERPRSLFFSDPKTGLRVDLLLDFPLPAHAVAGRAEKINVGSGRLRIASTEDLRRLKEIAYADRRSASDAQDLEFLKRKTRE